MLSNASRCLAQWRFPVALPLSLLSRIHLPIGKRVISDVGSGRLSTMASSLLPPKMASPSAMSTLHREWYWWYWHKWQNLGDGMPILWRESKHGRVGEARIKCSGALCSVDMLQRVNYVVRFQWNEPLFHRNSMAWSFVKRFSQGMSLFVQDYSPCRISSLALKACS